MHNAKLEYWLKYKKQLPLPAAIAATETLRDMSQFNTLTCEAITLRDILSLKAVALVSLRELILEVSPRTPILSISSNHEIKDPTLEPKTSCLHKRHELLSNPASFPRLA